MRGNVLAVDFDGMSFIGVNCLDNLDIVVVAIQVLLIKTDAVK